jgi:hypothetical protein
MGTSPWFGWSSAWIGLMEENNVSNGTQLLLKRNIPIKVVVTPLWKKEMQEQLERQIEATDCSDATTGVSGQAGYCRTGETKPPTPTALKCSNRWKR